jgi:hypothetical protein
VFDEVARVLKQNGTCFVNLGDSYFGSGKGFAFGLTPRLRGLDHGICIVRASAKGGRSLLPKFRLDLAKRDHLAQAELHADFGTRSFHRGLRESVLLCSFGTVRLQPATRSDAE